MKTYTVQKRHGFDTTVAKTVTGEDARKSLQTTMRLAKQEVSKKNRNYTVEVYCGKEFVWKEKL